jgi:hypothetical protein
LSRQPSELERQWEQLGVVRSLEVLSVAGDIPGAVVVSTSAGQDPEHRGDEEDQAEDQRCKVTTE